MKKISALLMAAAMTLSLTACGGSSEPAASAPAAAEDFKVGAIYINSKKRHRRLHLCSPQWHYHRHE